MNERKPFRPKLLIVFLLLSEWLSLLYLYLYARVTPTIWGQLSLQIIPILVAIESLYIRYQYKHPQTMKPSTFIIFHILQAMYGLVVCFLLWMHQHIILGITFVVATIIILGLEYKRISS